MNKKQLTEALLEYSIDKLLKSEYKHSSAAVQRTYQLGSIIGLLTDIAADDFYAMSQLNRLLDKKDQNRKQ
jgi:hypothetical protein